MGANESVVLHGGMRSYGITVQAVLPGQTYPVNYSGNFVGRDAAHACVFAVEMMKALYPQAPESSISVSFISPILYQPANNPDGTAPAPLSVIE